MPIGIVLLVLGAVLMAVEHYPYKDTDPVIDVGSIETTKTETKHGSVPVAVGGTILGVGAIAKLGCSSKRLR